MIESPPLILWYDRPAKRGMAEPLCIGNGRLGAMNLGEPVNECILLNEISLWTGGLNPTGEYEEEFGAYQALGEIRLHLPGHLSPHQYCRSLDLSQALAQVRYEVDGVTFHREIFASRLANVLIVRLSADQPGRYTGTIELIDAHDAKVIATDQLTARGTLSNGLIHETQLLAAHEGGHLRVDPESREIQFTHCDALTLLLAARTNYVMDFARQYRGPDPHPLVTADLAAAAKPYDALKAEHIADYQKQFGRVRLGLGESTPQQRAQPTDRRKAAVNEKADPELEALLFQFGRYLLISSSQPGSLPANLQGLWNDSNSPEWHCDYHTNINIQMNYWPAEVTNLAECHRPLFDLIRSQLPAWRAATTACEEFRTPAGHLTCRGFAVRTSHNIFGGMGWQWDKTANAWYCQHLWEHYAFGRDPSYLRKVAYPILKETVEFWEDHLKPLPDGRLVVPQAWSPEHGPTEDGVSYAQQIVWDLFNHYAQACDALGIDIDYRNHIADLRDRLYQPGVGSWGQLLEWMKEKRGEGDLDTPADHHRHTSHLFAVFPGRQINWEKTPELAAAAKVSLAARGDGGDVREWSFAWRAALWARLQDAEAAHEQIRHFLADRNSCPNLFGLHPPMQIDGNFGVTAAIAEMLLQSHKGRIDLLPALPRAWRSGHVTGLRARGGFEVDMRWDDSRLIETTIRGAASTSCEVCYKDERKLVHLSAGKTMTWNWIRQRSRL
jgi:alpha-L-fucosidase 2